MMIAQKLYEGIALEDETVGLITYMRTDSTRLSDLFVESATEYIKEKYNLNLTGEEMMFLTIHLKRISTN